VATHSGPLSQGQNCQPNPGALLTNQTNLNKNKHQGFLQKKLKARKRGQGQVRMQLVLRRSRGLSWVRRAQEQVEVDTLSAQGQLHGEASLLPQASTQPWLALNSQHKHRCSVALASKVQQTEQSRSAPLLLAPGATPEMGKQTHRQAPAEGHTCTELCGGVSSVSF